MQGVSGSASLGLAVLTDVRLSEESETLGGYQESQSPAKTARRLSGRGVRKSFPDNFKTLPATQYTGEPQLLEAPR